MVKKNNPSVKTDHQKEVDNELVLSYQTLRNLIGFSGMLLPLALIYLTVRVQGDPIIQPSISHYFYTSSGDIFVVILCIIGVFLFTHQGYNKWDKFCNTIAGLAAICIAFNPTKSIKPVDGISKHTHLYEVPEIFNFELHFIFALTFFISIAFITLFLFTKSKNNNPSPQKIKRNRLYYISGSLIVLSLILLALYFIFKEQLSQQINNLPVVFILETIAVEAFALSFLTKGETFFPDGPHYITKGIEEVKTTINEALK